MTDAFFVTVTWSVLLLHIPRGEYAETERMQVGSLMLKPHKFHLQFITGVRHHTYIFYFRELLQKFKMII